MQVGWTRLILGVIFAALGVVWALQGANLIGGSVMTGRPIWIWIGVPVALGGLGLAGSGFLRRA